VNRAALALAALALAAAPARAFDAATTHAGLTERAALASRLGRLLVDVHGRPLGLYEPLRLNLKGEAGSRTARLGDALSRLDPAQGYAPTEGRLTALEWLVAGSVIEEVPASRARNHFYDPATGRGLDQGGFLSGLDVRLAAAAHGEGSLRGVFTGASFDGTGRPATAWLVAADNDLALGRFLDARERSVVAATPAEREAALAESLLVAGALLHLVEDAAEPALVHGDFREEFAREAGPFRRWVAARYGRLGVPEVKGDAVEVARLGDLITSQAERTARRFFSLGTLPGERAGSGRPSGVLAGKETTGYATGEGARHLARWRRDADGRIHWSLDERCYQDYAEALLPEAGLGALSALEHLWRGALAFDGDGVRIDGRGLGAGKLAFYAEDERGARRLVSTSEVTGANAGMRLAAIPTVSARRLAVVFRGLDAGGEPIVVSAERAQPIAQ
jgi:hypothetical protein